MLEIKKKPTENSKIRVKFEDIDFEANTLQVEVQIDEKIEDLQEVGELALEKIKEEYPQFKDRKLQKAESRELIVAHLKADFPNLSNLPDPATDSVSFEQEFLKDVILNDSQWKEVSDNKKPSLTFTKPIKDIIIIEKNSLEDGSKILIPHHIKEANEKIAITDLDLKNNSMTIKCSGTFLLDGYRYSAELMENTLSLGKVIEYEHTRNRVIKVKLEFNTADLAAALGLDAGHRSEVEAEGINAPWIQAHSEEIYEAVFGGAVMVGEVAEAA